MAKCGKETALEHLVPDNRVAISKQLLRETVEVSTQCRKDLFTFLLRNIPFKVEVTESGVELSFNISRKNPAYCFVLAADTFEKFVHI